MTVDQFLADQDRENRFFLVHRKFLDVVGDLHAGIMLSRLVYWMGFKRNGEPRSTIEFEGKRWVAKTGDQWWDECYLTVDQARRCVEILRDQLGVIETSVRHWNGKKVTHMTITGKLPELLHSGYSPDTSIRATAQMHPVSSPDTSIYGSKITTRSTDLLGVKNPRRAGICTLKTYFKRCKEAGVDPIPDDDSVFEYVEKIGLSREMIELAWLVFQRKYTENEKKYKCWPTVFRNAVRENWFKLWWQSPEGWALTTTGKQAQLEHESKGSDE